MELRSLMMVERVSKANLRQVDKSGVHPDHKHDMVRNKHHNENNEVEKEIIKNLGRYPPIVDPNYEKPDLENLKREYDEGIYEPDLNTLAEKLIVYI
ncbi:hypothetical protein QTV49_000315 [Vibrio vulnificus]|nr:hypothetical protein [Vibrio vulnificus]